MQTPPKKPSHTEIMLKELQELMYIVQDELSVLKNSFQPLDLIELHNLVNKHEA